MFVNKLLGQLEVRIETELGQLEVRIETVRTIGC